MKIINPLYDYAFKYLMQNDRIAKKVLSTLLECEILELTIEQQEVVSLDESRGLRLYRLDFNAIIVNEQGNKQKVLIELQKSKLPTNLLRFRTYLGEQYSKRYTVVNASGKEETEVYPIISIYILGYNVVDIPYLSVNIDRKITNTVTKEEVEVHSDFINLLTHRTRVIQIRRLSEKRQSRLERFLTLFNQTWITSDKFILDLEEIPNDFDDVVKYLGIPVNDEEFRKQLRAEEEIDAIFRNQEAELAEKEAELKEARQREEEARQQAQQAQQREQQARQQALQAQQREEQEKQEKQLLQIQLAKTLLQLGKSSAEIAKMTGLSEEIISNL